MNRMLLALIGIFLVVTAVPEQAVAGQRGGPQPGAPGRGANASAQTAWWTDTALMTSCLTDLQKLRLRFVWPIDRTSHPP